MNGLVAKEVTIIQECNYKRINTKGLFEEFCIRSENLSFEYGNLKLNGNYIYNQPGDVFKWMNVIDIAIDRCDTLYLVDKEKNLYTYRANENFPEKIGNIEKILSSGLNTISAIGVDKDTIYIADCVSSDQDDQTEKGPPRLIALTKNDLQVRWTLSTGPDGRSLNKIHSIQCDNRGKIYFLEEKEKRILYVSTGDICYPTFRPFDLSFKLEQGDFKPQDLALGVDGALYVLFVNDEANEKTLSETKGYVLKVLWKKKEKSIEMFGPKISDFPPSGIAVDIWNQIFIGETKTDTPLPIRKLSNDAGEPWKSLTTYKFTDKSNRIGASRKLISDSKGNLYIINDKNKLVLTEREELNNKKGHFEGTYISKPIDSQISDTYWHRLLLEGDFEKGTQVDFHYFVSNNKDEGPQDSKFNNWLNCISKSSAIQGSNKRDALFIDNIKGRYLWFKITLSGTEKLSPAVKSVTIFFPRISYLDYLPDIYQEDPVSKGLLERFLAIFESIFYEIDFTIDHIGRFFDIYGAPPEFLSWLGSWLAVSMDEHWPEDKKRLFIRNVGSLYKKRGTREGLEESIELFTGKKPFIVERFQASKACKGNIKTEGNKDKEELLNKLYGDEKFDFCVLLADPSPDPTAQSHVRRIIEEQKPAHTRCKLKVLEPWFYLDKYTYLEINTVVTDPKFILEKTSMVGRDTVLHDEEKVR